MSFGAETPFILLARIQVKPDKVQEYLLLAAKTDKAVEDSEPGMLHHTFDQDPENPLRFPGNNFPPELERQLRLKASDLLTLHRASLAEFTCFQKNCLAAICRDVEAFLHL